MDTSAPIYFFIHYFFNKLKHFLIVSWELCVILFQLYYLLIKLFLFIYHRKLFKKLISFLYKLLFAFILMIEIISNASLIVVIAVKNFNILKRFLNYIFQWRAFFYYEYFWRLLKCSYEITDHKLQRIIVILRN
jgi:hypothetical protein